MPYEEDYKMWLEKALIGMNPDWVCDEMSDNEFTHNWCHQSCGEDDAYITPKCLHMYYHHIARADRNCSEKPNSSLDKDTNVRSNDCETCKHYHPDHEAIACERCLDGKYSRYEPKTEPETEYPRCHITGIPLDECGFCEYFNCDTCKCEANEPRTEVTTDCRQTKMTLDDAYYLVYKDLTKEDGILTGKYDAKNGNKQFMNGVWTVMELIAYGVGIDCYEAFNERFCRNLEKSQEQTERSEQ